MQAMPPPHPSMTWWIILSIIDKWPALENLWKTPLTTGSDQRKIFWIAKNCLPRQNGRLYKTCMRTGSLKLLWRRTALSSKLENVQGEGCSTGKCHVLYYNAPAKGAPGLLIPSLSMRRMVLMVEAYSYKVLPPAVSNATTISYTCCLHAPVPKCFLHVSLPSPCSRCRHHTVQKTSTWHGRHISCSSWCRKRKSHRKRLGSLCHQ